MKRPSCPTLALLTLATPVLLPAHPGHGGPPDLEWDFVHLAGHPLATILCLAAVATAGGLAWKYRRARGATARPPLDPLERR